MEIEVLKRTFYIEKDGKEILLSDPGQEMTPNKVKDFHADEFPELLTATITGPIYEGEEAKYIFKANAGTKG